MLRLCIYGKESGYYGKRRQFRINNVKHSCGGGGVRWGFSMELWLSWNLQSSTCLCSQVPVLKLCATITHLMLSNLSNWGSWASGKTIFWCSFTLFLVFLSGLVPVFSWTKEKQLLLVTSHQDIVYCPYHWNVWSDLNKNKTDHICGS